MHKFHPLRKMIRLRERSQKGSRIFSIGVLTNTGTGVGGDRTAICITRTGYDAFPDVQVAEFASDDIDNVAIEAWATAIASWYGKFYEEGETPRIIIEQKRKYGDSCYHALKGNGFRNHHIFRMYDKKTLRPRPSVESREDGLPMNGPGQCFLVLIKMAWIMAGSRSTPSGFWKKWRVMSRG